MTGNDCNDESPETTMSTVPSWSESLASPISGAAQRVLFTTNTISGASGKHLAEELKRWADKRRRDSSTRFDLARNVWERAELRVASYYDSGPFATFINFLYDILQLSSGRDKLCALLQGYAKFMSAWVPKDGERYFMYRGMEDSLSDGRKIFRLFKEFREVYKVRRGFHRMQEGIASHGIASVPAVCGTMDVLGHTASFFYYLYDNISWAASVGLLRTKEIPKWQVGMWKGFRRNGKVVNFLGGMSSIKKQKNYASIWRLNFAITANVLLLMNAVRESGRFEGPDDPRLFHTLELVGMAANYYILMSKLNFVKLKSHSTSGLLSIVGALCGIWSNYRKVRRKNCGTKDFVTVVDQREKAAAKLRSMSLNDVNGMTILASKPKLENEKLALKLDIEKRSLRSRTRSIDVSA